MKILVTGAAGFIGFHVARALLAAGHTVAGLDNCNPYYDVALKKSRLALLREFDGFAFHEVDLADLPAVEAIFAGYSPEVVIHLAAQAGVRYSIENPGSYIQSNLVGFHGILENCRRYPVSHLVYASSSSVYGLNSSLPFAETDRTDHPASLYAATKRSNELMAHAYSHLYSIPVTGLRFFTVYGPWGRPDMAPFIFTKAILEGSPIRIFNNGQMQRDFTYIDDIVSGVVRVMDHIPAPDSSWNSGSPLPSSSSAPFRIYNIGNNQSVPLETFIAALEDALGKKAVREYLPMQMGDVVATYADITALHDVVGFAPETPIAVGVPRFVAWYKEYHGLR
ncbi:NAD-dependent epimerase [Desulfovibrio sp. OttesenSCG-928-O18]|nr:NAD-dependent epimerase [Desulfovibrio sp. OttesenSCG-928-O18]